MKYELKIYPFVEGESEISIGVQYFKREYLRTGCKKIMFFLRLGIRSVIFNIFIPIRE